MTRQEKGYTIVELLVLLAIIGVTMALVIGALGRFACSSSKGMAEREAWDWARNIPGTTQVVCVDRDSDNNGYISCTVFRGERDPLYIECADRWSTNSGCRMITRIKP